jgi:hypothetical protein
MDIEVILPGKLFRDIPSLHLVVVNSAISAAMA